MMFMELDSTCEVFANRDIEFTFLHYGKNAVETRKTFWKANQEFFYDQDILDYDLIITDITGYAGTMSYDLPFINNFNVTKLPELNRPYIDEFFEKDLESMEKALFTTVINPRQREYILSVAPHLKDKVFAYTKLAHYSFMPVDHRTRIYTPSETILWPFRISDKAYKFEEFVKVYCESGLYRKYKLVITDPNKTFKMEMIPDECKDYVFVVSPTKEEYYKMLADKPVVVMLDDIDTVLHPGTIEFMHYGVKLITFENQLVQHCGTIHTIEQIPQKIGDMGYNGPINTSDFVYWPREVSKFYNNNNIEQCIQNS
jgi:hypothetical protein